MLKPKLWFNTTTISKVVGQIQLQKLEPHPGKDIRKSINEYSIWFLIRKETENR